MRDPTRDTDCEEGSICLLDGVLNRCVTSKFLRYQHFSCFNSAHGIETMANNGIQIHNCYASIPASHSLPSPSLPLTHSTGPGNNEMCDRDGSDPRDLDDGDEDDDDDEFRRELDDDDRDFFDRIEGAEDRLRAFSIQASASIEPCAEGFQCTASGDTQRCTMITGLYFIWLTT